MTELIVAEARLCQLYALYTDAVWRKDAEAFADCFTEDAEWRISGNVLRGRKQIRGMIETVFPRYQRILLSFRHPIIDVGDRTANVRIMVSEQSVLDGRPFAPIGTYYDRCVEQDARWRFGWRLFQTHYAGPPDMTGQFFDNPDYGRPPAMPPLDAETYDHTGNLKR